MMEIIGGDMRTQVVKWGNSLAIRIPDLCARDLKLEKGTELEISLVEGALLLRSRGTGARRLLPVEPAGQPVPDQRGAAGEGPGGVPAGGGAQRARRGVAASIAEVYQELGQDEEAARWFHQFLLHARHAPARTPPDLLRNLVRHAVETLFDLHMKSGQKIPVFPGGPAPGQEPGPAKDADEPEVVYLTDFDLDKEEDWERLVDWWVAGKPPLRSTPMPKRGHPPKRHREHPPALRPRPAPGVEGRVGRNDPCPCGSGKKFKNCGEAASGGAR